MSSSQKDKLLTAINEKDKELVQNIIAYFDKNPTHMEVLSEKVNSAEGHINFLRGLQEDYSQKKSKFSETDLLTSKHKSIASEWECLLRAAVACLRRKDIREPFNKNPGQDRQPTAYGVETIKDFYDKFIVFEDILYGADRWYRDHVMHAYRVWLLGMDLLITVNDAGEILALKVAEEMGVDGFKDRRDKDKKEALDFRYDPVEIFSMWTIAALTHDLGYPLQKAPKLLRTIHEMMGYFVVAPDLKHDFRFNTAADSVNDYIVRLISTKMVRKVENETDDRACNEICVNLH